jgi:hypothetical protein
MEGREEVRYKIGQEDIRFIQSGTVIIHAPPDEVRAADLGSKIDPLAKGR